MAASNADLIAQFIALNDKSNQAVQRVAALEGERGQSRDETKTEGGLGDKETLRPDKLIRHSDSKELAEEALIANRSKFHHNEENGPINVYECEDCGNWHFTSKGPKSELLSSPEIRKSISLNREASYWERKLR